MPTRSNQVAAVRAPALTAIVTAWAESAHPTVLTDRRAVVGGGFGFAENLLIACNTQACSANSAVSPEKVTKRLNST